MEAVERITVNSLFSPPPSGGGGVFISTPFEWEPSREGGLFNLEKTMVSVLHKEQRYKVEKLK